MQVTQVISAKGTAGSALTVTIPAPTYSGGYIYITGISIWRSSAAAVAGTAVLDLTTTNLRSLEWLVGNAIAAGQTIKDVEMQVTFPFRSTSAGTPVTFVLPAAGTGVQWSVNVMYNYNS